MSADDKRVATMPQSASYVLLLARREANVQGSVLVTDAVNLAQPIPHDGFDHEASTFSDTAAGALRTAA